MQFGWGRQPKPPPPPPPPATIPATVLIRRDLLPYGALIALGLAPAFDWVSLGGPDAVNAARLAYYLVLSVGSVYLGVQRQDLGAASPIGEKQAALAPVFASVTLGGLYLLIKCTASPIELCLIEC